MIRRIDFSDTQWSITRAGWDAFDMQVLDCIQQWKDDSNTLRVLTSGTTGAQRVLDIPKEWVIQSTRRTMTALGLKDGYHAHLCLPLDFIAGKMVVWRTMVAQGVLSWEEPSSSPHFDLQVTADIVSVTPHQMHAMLQKYSGTVWPMRKLLIGGGPMSPPLRERLPLEPIECYETYGMAESISHIALRSLSDTESWFKPMQDVELSVDERGCLHIQIPYFDGLKIQTQDVVELRPTGEFRWLGRADWVINSGGVKLFPEHMEERLSPLISCPFVVHGVADDVLGTKAVLFIESSPWSAEEVEMLQRNMQSVFSSIERPREVRFIASFQRTSSGKIKRNLIL